jgi:hypothetical protein
MAMLAGLTGGAGGISGGDQQSRSGNADVRAATGNKTINVGGNPNVSQALGSPWVIAAVVIIAVVYLWKR